VNDLVISVSCNYGWSHLREYANSLSTVFEGKKVMCVRDLSSGAYRNLQASGFELAPFPIGKGTFFISRYGAAVEYVKKNLSDLRYVIWTDCRDVVFQTNPFMWLEKHLYPSKVLGCSLGKNIKEDGLEAQWVSICSNPEAFEWLKEEPALCVGAIAGEASTMLDVLAEIYDRGVALSDLRPDFSVGMDEGLFNYVLRTKFKSVMRVPTLEDCFAAHCTYLLLPNFVRPWEIRDSGLIYPVGKEEPFSIVHQYDRDERWKRLVQSRYSDKDPSRMEDENRSVGSRSRSRWLGRSRTAQ